MLRRLLLATLFMVCASPAFAATVSIVVDLSSQQMVVSIGGQTEYVWDVSTGRKGYRTPKGSYSPQRLYAEYYSKKYDGAPMPYSIFFSGGYAIHGTNHVRQLGAPASHGCVRLHTANARELFYIVQEFGYGNTSIRIRS